MRVLRRWAFVALEVVLLAAVPALAWAGFRTVLDTTAGKAVDPELDPDEPGYEAFVGTTPVGLLLGVDDAGALSWVATVVLGGEEAQGGTLLLLPPATVAEAGELGEVTLAAAFAAEGRPVVAQAVADLLGVGFDESIVVEPARIAELVAPVAPLTLTVVDDVDGFDAGEQALGGPEFAAFLSARAPGETDLNRFVRHESAWRVWLDAVAVSPDPDAVPGERTAGIGRFVRGLAAGPRDVVLLPVDPVVDPETGEERFDPDGDEIGTLIDEVVPFPAAPHPGGRARVRVLDAVGVDGLALLAARDAVRGGAQIVVIGNADEFGAATSRVVYFDPALARAAEEVADAVGVVDVERLDGPNPNDLVDVTVVVGMDLAEAYGLEPRTATTGGDDAG